LKRDPDVAGYAFWLNKLNQYPSFVEAEMVLAFISSPEYRAAIWSALEKKGQAAGAVGRKNVIACTDSCLLLLPPAPGFPGQPCR